MYPPLPFSHRISRCSNALLFPSSLSSPWVIMDTKPCQLFSLSLSILCRYSCFFFPSSTSTPFPSFPLPSSSSSLHPPEQATMLKKTSKSKLRRRNTEPSMVAKEKEQSKLQTIRPDPASSSHPL